MITWLLLKFGFGLVANVWIKRIDAFFSLIGKIFAFIFAPRRIYGAIAIPLVGAVLIYHFWAQTVDIQARFDNHLADEKALTDTQRLNNAVKKSQGETTSKTIELENKQALQRLGLSELDRTKLQQQLRAYQHENKYLETRLNDTNSNWNQRVQLDAEAARNRLGMPEESEADCDTAHTGRNCDTSINRTLIDACKITTVDLISCIESLDNDTATVGREQ